MSQTLVNVTNSGQWCTVNKKAANETTTLLQLSVTMFNYVESVKHKNVVPSTVFWTSNALVLLKSVDYGHDSV